MSDIFKNPGKFSYLLFCIIVLKKKNNLKILYENLCLKKRAKFVIKKAFH